MHKSATKCNEIIGKWYKNKHGASKIIDTLETYQQARPTTAHSATFDRGHVPSQASAMSAYPQTLSGSERSHSPFFQPGALRTHARLRRKGTRELEKGNRPTLMLHIGEKEGSDGRWRRPSVAPSLILGLGTIVLENADIQ
jgi:hypothetical protein